MPSPRTRTASPAASDPPRPRSVFLNCPFDDEYRPIFRAICFAVLACGHAPRCALDISDSGAVRLQEIVTLITRCAFSIHDISRVELDSASKLPRFNIPLELGADLGLRLAGPVRQRARKTLVLDAESHRYDVMLSDISGMDIGAHRNQPNGAIKQVRDWLNAHRGDRPSLPGAAAISDDYAVFLDVAPDIITALRLDPHDELPHRDYLDVVEQALPLIEQIRSR